MTTRWEVEAAVGASGIAPIGRFLLLSLLTKTTAGTAVIPPKHAPSYTDLESLTGLSRSTLIEWMKALTDGGWVKRVAFEGESKEGFALSMGDPGVAPAPRPRGGRPSSAARIPAPRAEMDTDAPYRLAVHPEGATVPPGGTDRTAERYSTVPPGGTTDDVLLIRNSPTESSLTTSTLTPPLFGEDATTDEAPPKKARKSRKVEQHREDVERICQHLVEAVVANGSKRPTITDKWRTEARLLLDEERSPTATPERVIALIDWVKTNEWWQARVLSMPKLRAKYDEVRLDALRDYNRKNGQGAGSTNGFGYRSQKVNHDEPGAHKRSWDRRRQQHAQQQ